MSTDKTPVEWTHPAVFAAAERGESWADPETDPTRIDWPARQVKALIPFEVRDSRPVRPGPSTGIHRGRGELGHWGEQSAADAIVTAADSRGHRWLLMVERGDGHGWALPGGKIDPGEDPLAAAIRELAEETGLRLPGAAWRQLEPRLVPDPRGTDESWMVTVPALTGLVVDNEAGLPPVCGMDDAARAAWLPADTYTLLTTVVAQRGGQVFQAHRQLVADVLGRGLELVITRGLPGCGKSTFARRWVAAAPTSRARINRDDTRGMLHGGPIGASGEQQVTTATHAAVAALLASGISVICDDTNLPDEYAAALAVLGEAAGAAVRIEDMRAVPLAICLERNAQRSSAGRVPEQVIQAMHTQFIKPQS